LYDFAVKGSIPGRTIVILRPSAQAKNLKKLLERERARVVCAPVIKIVQPDSFVPLDRALNRLAGYDWVVFSSANAVRSFLARAKKLKISKPAARSAAVGAATASLLKEAGWKASFVARESTGAALARDLPVRRGDKVLLPRAKKAGEDLPRILRARGAKVDAVEAYRTVADARGPARVKSLMARGRVDAVAFTSASTAEHLRRGLGAGRGRALLSAAAAASIGPVTSAALRRYGARPVQARSAGDAALAAVIKDLFA
jgi:uroporphyrinogen III methyltransferase/synthase